MFDSVSLLMGFSLFFKLYLFLYCYKLACNEL